MKQKQIVEGTRESRKNKNTTLDRHGVPRGDGSCMNSCVGKTALGTTE